MSKRFDKRVEYAVEQLWIKRNKAEGARAKQMLREAAEEGNADAYYFLGRCCLGDCFIDPVFGFEENEYEGIEYFRKSIEMGSAVGMFASMRLAGFIPPDGTFVHPPYYSLKEIWDEVEALANDGQSFCQLLIGNAYYFLDAIKFLQVQNVHDGVIRGYMYKAMQYYDMSIANGNFFVIQNYLNIVSSGEHGMPIDRQKEQALIDIGAENGVGFCELRKGDSYGIDDAQTALDYYQRALEHGDSRAHGRIGKVYFYGGRGVEKDYYKAMEHFLIAREQSNWVSDMLGTCYLKGWGTAVNYAAAKREFEEYPGERLSAIGLGEIYAYGLGVPADIKKGLQYWDKFPGDIRVIENKRNFKKTLFGWKCKKA
ncbi:MAG: hypothetical protein K2P63_05400 [Lachnospiraceae bacterium]|nr:hypothetical protein [Lachnospiraceae bacterium]